MNKLNLHKAMAAGIFAATIVVITACGGSGSSSPAKITTVAGGGDATTGTNPTQASLGLVSSFAAKDGDLLFNSDRDGTGKLHRLDLATNQLATPEAYSNIGTGENLFSLLAAKADKYYFWVYKENGLYRGHALYQANSELASTHIAGNIDATNATFVADDKGKLATFSFPSSQVVLYNDGSNDQLFFTDSYKIRKVKLSGDYPTTTVKDNSEFKARNLALMGNKLLVTDFVNSLVFEHSIKDSTEAIVAGLKNVDGYENAANPLQAKLNFPGLIATSPTGDIFFTVSGLVGSNQRIIRKLAVSKGVYGAVTTAFGAAPGGTVDSAELIRIYDLEFVDNDLYVLDFGADNKYRIKRIESVNQTP